ncbi:MAG: hypothetical protein ACLGI5_09690 [Thermoleophilia bacterium]
MTELRRIELARHPALPEDERIAVVARVGGQVAGEASYQRIYGPRAVLSLDVDEAFWHLGTPQRLIAALGEQASLLGIATFLIRVRASDLRLLAMLREDFGARGRRDGGFVELQFPASGRSDRAT